MLHIDYVSLPQSQNYTFICYYLFIQVFFYQINVLIKSNFLLLQLAFVTLPPGQTFTYPDLKITDKVPNAFFLCECSSIIDLFSYSLLPPFISRTLYTCDNQPLRHGRRRSILNFISFLKKAKATGVTKHGRTE